MSKLTLDHVERDALTGELKRVSMAQLMRRETAPNTGLSCEPSELDTDAGV